MDKVSFHSLISLTSIITEAIIVVWDKSTWGQKRKETKPLLFEITKKDTGKTTRIKRSSLKLGCFLLADIYGQEKQNKKVFLLTQNKATNIKSCNIKKGQNNYMKIPSSSQSSLLWFRFLLASASEGSHSWPRPPWYQWDEDGIDEYHRSSRSIRSIEAYRNENEDKYNLLWEEKTLVSVSGIRGNTVRVPDDGQDGDGRCDGNMLVGIGRDNENNWLCWLSTSWNSNLLQPSLKVAPLVKSSVLITWGDCQYELVDLGSGSDNKFCTTETKKKLWSGAST